MARRDSEFVLMCVTARPGHAGHDKASGETTAARQGSDHRCSVLPGLAAPVLQKMLHKRRDWRCVGTI